MLCHKSGSILVFVLVGVRTPWASPAALAISKNVTFACPSQGSGRCVRWFCPPANWSPASWPVSWECNPSLGTYTDSSGNANQFRLAPWCGGGLSLPHTATAIIAGHGLEYIFGQGVQPMELCQWNRRSLVSGNRKPSRLVEMSMMLRASFSPAPLCEVKRPLSPSRIRPSLKESHDRRRTRFSPVPWFSSYQILQTSTPFHYSLQGAWTILPSLPAHQRQNFFSLFLLLHTNPNRGVNKFDKQHP